MQSLCHVQYFSRKFFSRNHSSRNVNRRSVRLNNCRTFRISSIYPNYFVKRSFKKVKYLMKKMFFFNFFELRRHNWPRIIVFSWFLSLMTYCTRVRNHMIKYRWQHNYYVQISQCSRVQECYTMVGQCGIGLSPFVNFFLISCIRSNSLHFSFMIIPRWL